MTECWCPYSGCENCAYQGGETFVTQGDSWENGDSKTAPGVALTNTGSLAHSDASKPHGRTCIR